jgi:hypothetical protein
VNLAVEFDEAVAPDAFVSVIGPKGNRVFG